MIRIYWKKGVLRASHHVVGRAMIKQVFGDVPIAAGPGGKPYLVGGQAFFNLSHSGEVVALAVGQQELGFDLEWIRPVRLGRFMRPEEKEVDPLTLFVVKESAVKWAGIGLRGLEACRIRQEGAARFIAEIEGKRVLVRIFDRQGCRCALAVEEEEPFDIYED